MPVRFIRRLSRAELQDREANGPHKPETQATWTVCSHTPLSYKMITQLPWQYARVQLQDTFYTYAPTVADLELKLRVCHIKILTYNSVFGTI